MTSVNNIESMKSKEEVYKIFIKALNIKLRSAGQLYKPLVGLSMILNYCNVINECQKSVEYLKFRI